MANGNGNKYIWIRWIVGGLALPIISAVIAYAVTIKINEVKIDTVAEDVQANKDMLSNKVNKEDFQKVAMKVDAIDSVVTVMNATQALEFKAIKETLKNIADDVKDLDK